jgi:hypothetical protein
MDGIILIDEDIPIGTPKKIIKHERLNDMVTLFPGDCRDAMREFEDDCIDAIVTDAPYHLQSIVDRFGKENSAPPLDYEGGTGVYKRASAGFMGKQWDGGDIAFQPEFWREVFRIMKPGAHLVCFGGTRTYHRMACAIEDAGFEIRDCIQWLYGQGFPKSHDISKQIDKLNGAESKVVGSKMGLPGYSLKENDTGEHDRNTYSKYSNAEKECAITAPVTSEAQQWNGWGTALKPAAEIICLVRAAAGLAGCIRLLADRLAALFGALPDEHSAEAEGWRATCRPAGCRIAPNGGPAVGCAVSARSEPCCAQLASKGLGGSIRGGFGTVRDQAVRPSSMASSHRGRAVSARSERAPKTVGEQSCLPYAEP